MRIGLTYDLKDDYLHRGLDAETLAELDKPDTIDALEQALLELGYEVDRIGNLNALLHRLVRYERWDLVFNITEGLYGYGRESVVPALLDARQIPYVFSDPLALAVTLHKPTAKRLLRDHGVRTPEFRVVHDAAGAREVDLEPPLFVKPVAEGSSKGITRESRVDDRERLELVCEALVRHHGQPVIVERFLPGREFTVGMVGSGCDTSVLGVMEILIERSASHSYSLEVKSAVDYHEIVTYRLCDEPDLRAECERTALAAWRALECRDCGRVDLRLDADGLPHVLEINPLAGIHPTDSDLTILTGRLLGLSHVEFIGRIMASFHDRTSLPIPAPMTTFVTA